MVITADEGVRAGKKIPLKANVGYRTSKRAQTCIQAWSLTAQAAASLGSKGATFGITRPRPQQPMSVRPKAWMQRIPCSYCTPRALPASPKGVLHTTGGYLLQAAMTFKYAFDYSEGEIMVVYRRCRLGHGPHLHRLRPARQRRNLSDL